MAMSPVIAFAKSLQCLAGHLHRVALTVVFPPRCQACGEIMADGRGRLEGEPVPAVPLTSPEGSSRGWLPGFVRQVLTPWLCADCLAGLEPLDGPVCTICGAAFQSRQVADHACGQCLEAKRAYGCARSVLSYNEVARRLVHQLKFHDRLQLARPLGRLMFALFWHVWKDRTVDAVAPVPLHLGRFRQRGFNQAWALVRDWPMGCGPGTAWRLERHVLARVGWNRPQTGLSAGQRANNIKGAFAVGSGAVIAGRRILLVDDVMTTGATVSECARVLTRAGAESVDVLTLARA